MAVSTAFFTVCGGGEDYEFLLGAIEHHAEMGRHLVLDATPAESARSFKRLPASVRWIHEPLYGHGWKEFKQKTALMRAMSLAKEFGADVLVSLDSDEFYASGSVEGLFPHAIEAMLEVNYSHWMPDGAPYMFGESEWHRRLWPARSEAAIGLNLAWPKHPSYNGNPEHHALANPAPGMRILRVPGNFRQHLHYALGKKKEDDEIAKSTISGWPGQGCPVPPVPWPAKLALWRDRGVPPSEFFL